MSPNEPSGRPPTEASQLWATSSISSSFRSRHHRSTPGASWENPR